MTDFATTTVLHYVGYDDDRGGIVSVVRTLDDAGLFACELGVNRGFVQRREPHLRTLGFTSMPGETLDAGSLWRARVVAREVQGWLKAEPNRVFHAHSRAGLALALWLARMGEKRVVASVHCFGKRRWFYRWAARQLGDRLFWLSPAMKHYYRVATPDDPWHQCIPGCVALPPHPVLRAPRPNPEVVRIGGIGALVSWKCWHLVLDAMAAMPTLSRAKIRFRHLGAPQPTTSSQRYAAALRAQTSALRLDNFVEWRGSQPDSQDFLRDIDVLVVPSLHEPLSVAMLEALAAGVPVLAANSGGARDAIQRSQNGWLFRAGDVPELARALMMLAESDALQYVESAPDADWRFAAPVVAAQWARVYARLTGAPVREPQARAGVMR